ncbi:MAG: large conductance mechanosensitive channel protein MscL [Actinomycetota bacterium]
MPHDDRFSRATPRNVLRKTTKPLSDFRAFITKGNAIDLAIAVVIGTSFNVLVKSLVENVLTPLISIPGHADFGKLHACFRNSAHRCNQVNYGVVLNSLVSLLLTTAALYFLVVRPINRLREWRKGPPETKDCPECLSEIPVKATRCRACGIAIPVP